jgi:quinohemoprotein ethanol dehydrogenase
MSGGVLYAKYCSRCHGRVTSSHNVVPDLRRSSTLPDPALWKAVVIDGIFCDAGMISWRRFLSPQDAEKIRTYVATEAQILATEAK